MKKESKERDKRMNYREVFLKIIPYLEIEEIEFYIYLHSQQKIVDWRHISFDMNHIYYYYQQLNKESDYEKKKKYLSILFELIKNDHKLECNRMILYNLLFEYIYYDLYDAFYSIIQKYKLNISIPDNQLLNLVIKKGDTEMFYELLKNEDILKNLQPTNLYLTCLYKKYRYFEHFVEKSYYDMDDELWRTSFIYAIESGAMKIVQYILEEEKLRIEEIGEYKILRGVCKSGNLSLMKYLVKEWNLSINEDFQGILYEACENENIEIVRFLMEKSSITPAFKSLEVACRKNCIEIVELLLESEDINPYEKNYLCMKICCKLGYITLFKMFVDWNPHIDLTYEDGVFYKMAQYYGNHDICDYIFSRT